MIEAVNYDQISRTYEERYRVRKLEGVRASLLRLASETNVNKVLEVGCGTGRWLRVLGSEIDSYGLDQSLGMLRRAHLKNQELKLVGGNACSIPFSSDAFDLIVCVNAMHLFSSQQIFINEARRILRPGGKLAIIAANPHADKDQWYVYDYFEGAYERDRARYPDLQSVAEWLRQANFGNVSTSIPELICETMAGRAVFDDYFLKRSSTSLLASLPINDYHCGLQRMESAIVKAESKGSVARFRVKIPLFMLVAELSL
jgi:ubiquinone/menaquinone biosynthesis C-methylase UbiE